MSKKFKRLIFLVAGQALALVGGYSILHMAATLSRGYNALGGEICIFLLPAIIYVARRNKKDMREAVKR